MKIRLVILLLSLFVCSLSSVAQRVLEDESTITIRQHTADVVLTIDSKTKVNGTAVELNLVDPTGRTRASTFATPQLSAGKRKYNFAIPISDIARDDRYEIAWWRLAYRVGNSRGIASLTELLKDDFDLRASSFQRVIPGESVRVRVRSLKPFTEEPVKGVAIRGELNLDLATQEDDDELKLTATARTGGDGFAVIEFKIPVDLKLDDSPEIVITGQKNGIVRTIDEDLDGEDMVGSAVLMTDKPLYQPGQTFNVRALLLDPNNTVVPGAELEFRIQAEDGTVVFRETVTTSAFGICAISWPIPENAKLGNYRVRVDADGPLDEDRLTFKVSRYDLPNFAVTAKADKSYYLPGDAQARVEVTADYLFGKPVKSGKIRVVREIEREWNYREQKYDVAEGAVIEGTSDNSGKFVADINLRDDIAELKESEYRRFNDLSFAAYYTDLSTNRTEQRRFDIRLTKEPIHLYLIRWNDQHRDLPITAYVSTFYADGTPADCRVEIRDAKEIVSQFKTNSLGAGKFEIEIPADRIQEGDYKIQAIARDKKGQIGTLEESFGLETDEDMIRIQSDKAIYKPGEMIEMDLHTTDENAYVYVDVIKDRLPIDSRVVKAQDGRARVSIPYKPTFKGDLVIAAYTDKEKSRWSNQNRAVHGVVYPTQQNLVVNAKFTKGEYRPGEDAAIRFSVLDGEGNPIESAIGLGIFDKAIEERARTDAEFGEGLFGRFFRLMGYERSFGNLTLKDLNDLDLSRPIPSEMQLAAEIMLAGNWYFPVIYHSGDTEGEARIHYRELTEKDIKPVGAAIQSRFAKNFDHPVDEASLTQILAASGIDRERLHDPWGTRYIAEFSIDKTRNIVGIKTAGPDKRAGTGDDFQVWTSGFSYFAKTGARLDEIVRDYHERTGKYIRDLETLTVELEKAGLSASTLRDRWGRGYRITFEVLGRRFVIRLTSLGPNGYLEGDRYRSDDFEAWKNATDYFARTDNEINRILSNEVHGQKKPFPRNEREFAEILKRGGLDLATVVDGHGRPVYVIGVVEPRFGDRTEINDGRTTVRAVTEELMSFKIFSRGAEPDAGWDDVEIATFSGAISEAHAASGFGRADVTTTVFAGAKGAIRGTVTDPNGAIVANAEVTAIDLTDQSRRFRTQSDSDGTYLLANLPSGSYRVEVSFQGFSRFVFNDLRVRSQTVIELNVELRVAGVSAEVQVALVGDTLDSTNASIATTVTRTDRSIHFPYKEETSTPRVRQYFPESLVWRPELLTDKKGKAELNFKMADNITTWKMFAVASNKKGKVGVVEKEVTAFQSFFADLDPPKFLTEGDEIHLPTQIRNYTKQSQKVDVTMDRGDWFSFLEGNNKQRVDVASGASQNAVFGFKATSPVEAGKQRVTAVGQSDSDAIEKPVTVRPNGEEIVRTDSRVFNASTGFDLNFPANTLANTHTAELKIYPNLFSHVADSVEGLLKRPSGCGEQTISSTYPNLMILKFIKTDSPLRQKAQRYSQKGYERLTGYQVASGGFSYWGGKESADIALTAYALQFLNDAKAFVEVDPDVIKRAEEWLIAQQRADGSWTKPYRGESGEDTGRTKLITTYVTRSLAVTNSAKGKKEIATALAYLKSRNAEIDEPYAMALFGLASLDSGDIESAKQVAARLEQMAIAEGSTAYWKLETNTPFYGWGTAGRVETTALVLQLLTRTNESKQPGDTVSKGLQFLLKNKDRYGVWYSTQTTVNVLNAFLALLGSDVHVQPQTITVSIDGVDFPSINVAADRIDPIIVDLRGKITATTNAIDIKSSTNSPVMAQLVAKHYIDWRDSQSNGTNLGASRELRLDYKCDKASAAIMDEVTCSVDAERVGHRGYGMLLAEMGTPPGADVSRESLEAALASDWSLSRYEILPDRIVLYLWSKAGGTKFDFKFRPRYGINAQTPASVVYDYYNPEAHATIAPLKFQIR